jgi:hypothetical protein|tara:strand:- start:397 stop:846 length:450 start_codon:yes stop_codon:yes gene_type:complete
MSESTEQQALFEWAELYKRETPELEMLYAIPNQGGAGKAAIIRGQRMRREGQKKGIPDLCLPVRRANWNSLYIEMKDVKSGRMSPHQLDWAMKLFRHQNCCVLAHGFEAAREAIMEYLALDDSLQDQDEGGNNGRPKDPFGEGPYRLFK